VLFYLLRLTNSDLYQVASFLRVSRILDPALTHDRDYTPLAGSVKSLLTENPTDSHNCLRFRPVTDNSKVILDIKSPIGGESARSRRVVLKPVRLCR